MASSRPSATAPGGGRQAASILFVSRNRFETAVLGCWVLTLVVICLHPGINPGRHSVFIDYWHAGARWIRGEYLYPRYHNNQFFYSPLAAAWFAPFSSSILSNSRYCAPLSIPANCHGVSHCGWWGYSC